MKIASRTTFCQYSLAGEIFSLVDPLKGITYDRVSKRALLLQSFSTIDE